MSHSVIDQDTHLCPFLQIGGHEGRIWVFFVQILVDDAGLVEYGRVICQDGNFTVGIELQIFGRLLLALSQIDGNYIVWQILFRQDDLDPLTVR